MIQPPNRVASPAQADPSHEQVSVREEAGATLAALMPWGVSLAIHAALVTLALLVIWAVIDDQETDAGMDVAVMSNPAPASALHSMIQTRDLHDDVPTARPDTAPNPTPAPDTIGTASRDAAVAEVFNTGDLGMPDLGDYTPRAKQGEIFDPRPPKKGIDRPLRVVRVIGRLNVGGPAQHVVLLNEGLERRGYETHLVCGAQLFCRDRKGAGTHGVRDGHRFGAFQRRAPDDVADIEVIMARAMQRGPRINQHLQWQGQSARAMRGHHTFQTVSCLRHIQSFSPHPPQR